MNFSIGDKVRCIDSTIEGKVLKILGRGHVLIFDEDSGMELDYSAKSLVKVGIEKLTATPAIKEADKAKPTVKGEMQADLHYEQLPKKFKGQYRIASQVEYARHIIHSCLSKNIKVVILVHGRGEGKLKAALSMMLHEFPQIKSTEDPDKILSMKGSRTKIIFK